MSISKKRATHYSSTSPDLDTSHHLLNALTNLWIPVIVSLWRKSKKKYYQFSTMLKSNVNKCKILTMPHSSEGFPFAVWITNTRESTTIRTSRLTNVIMRPFYFQATEGYNIWSKLNKGFYFPIYISLEFCVTRGLLDELINPSQTNLLLHCIMEI